MHTLSSSSQRPSFSLYLTLGSLSFFGLLTITRIRPIPLPEVLEKPVLLAAAPVFPMRPKLKSRHVTGRFDQFIQKAARENGLDPLLLRAVIQAESQFNPYDISPAGACGLMQLMPRTAKLLNVTDIFDPEQNIRGGARHLRYLMVKFSNNLAWALAAYNAGEMPVRRFKGIPPFPETQFYVKHVLKLYESSLS
jgi:soluble lytic murein transglycosylase-like protein